MTVQKPGIYRGKSGPEFGLWRLTERGLWLFSVPVRGETWHAAADQTGDDLLPLEVHRDEVLAYVHALRAAAQAIQDLHPGETKASVEFLRERAWSLLHDAPHEHGLVNTPGGGDARVCILEQDGDRAVILFPAGIRTYRWMHEIRPEQ